MKKLAILFSVLSLGVAASASAAPSGFSASQTDYNCPELSGSLNNGDAVEENDLEWSLTITNDGDSYSGSVTNLTWTSAIVDDESLICSGEATYKLKELAITATASPDGMSCDSAGTDNFSCTED